MCFRSKSTSKVQETLQTKIEDALQFGKRGLSFNKKGMNMQKEEYVKRSKRYVNADWDRDLHSAPCVDPPLSTDFRTKLAISRKISSSRLQYAPLGEKMSRFVSSLLCRSLLLIIVWSGWIFSGTQFNQWVRTVISVLLLATGPHLHSLSFNKSGQSKEVFLLF